MRVREAKIWARMSVWSTCLIQHAYYIVPSSRQNYFFLVGTSIKNIDEALASLAQWIEHRSADWRVPGLIPVKGTCLGCGLDPQCGACRRQPINDSFSSWMFLFLSPSPFLSEINFLKNTFKKEIALAGVAQWIEDRPADWRVQGLIPVKGTCLGCGLGPQ